MVNLFLCLVIFVFGLTRYEESKKKLPLFVGIAFGLFGTSHLLNIIGLGQQIPQVLIMIRITAYLLVLYALYDWKQKKK